jgi:hypothetical protein
MLEKKFNEDLRNVRRLSDQKIRGANDVSVLKDENKQIVATYENRLANARDEAKKNRLKTLEKEENFDYQNTEKLKAAKLSAAEALDKKEADLNLQHKNSFQEARHKTNALVDRYKAELGNARLDTEEKLGKSDSKAKNQLKNQRIEFGKYINDVNDKQMEEITLKKLLKR